jgi:soluble lytic murein transglycosylase-like protein
MALFALVLAGSPVVLLNLSVAFFGTSWVNPFSVSSLPLKAAALGRYFDHRSKCLGRGAHRDIDGIIRTAAKKHGLDARLLGALVEVESGRRAHRISGAGAMGPAQLMATTAGDLGVSDPFEPREAIDGGARYLRQQLVRFHGDVTLALAAYNAGPGSVIAGRVPRNGETERYVEKVLASFRAAGGGTSAAGTHPP